MNKQYNKFRNLVSLMNQETLLAYQSALDKLATLIATSFILDDLIINDNEEEMEDAIDNIMKLKEVIAPSIFACKAYDSVLDNYISESKVISDDVKEMINLILSYKKEQEDLTKTPFNPYSELDDLDMMKNEFYSRIQQSYLLLAVLSEIINDMLDYSKECFIIQEKNTSKMSIFDDLDNQNLDQVLEELNHLLEIKDTDLIEEREDKEAIVDLIKKLK